jgi:uncharacterized protein (DUF4213/DUF364 family)
MNFTDKTIQLAQMVSGQIAIPAVDSILLPESTDNDESVDEFGLLVLQDGSIGPFYTSLDETLAECWQLYPNGKSVPTDTLKLIENLHSPSAAERAVALGAFNALSQHVLRRANFSPLQPGNVASTGITQPEPGETVGMVGYFGRLIERLQAQHIHILVLEKNPQRVPAEIGVTLTTNAQDLARCQHILCTASTLINGTLENILQARDRSATFSLIGPSGSGLPDVLFEFGVDAVGGILFPDSALAISTFKQQRSWDKSGEKYQLTRANYPGIAQILEQIRIADKLMNSPD